MLRVLHARDCDAGGRFSARWTQRHDARVWRGDQQRRERHGRLGLCPGEREPMMRGHSQW